jgi:hypothetical protein
MKSPKENQNQREYGAPEMKKYYLKNFRRGLEFAILIHVLLISSYLLINYLNNLNADDHKKPVFDIKYVNVELDTPPPVDNQNTEIPKTEDIIKPVKDLTALDPDPVSKDAAEEMTIKTQDQLNNVIAQVSHDGDSVTYIANNNGNNRKDNIDISHNIDNIKKPPEGDVIYKPFEVECVPECVNMEMVRSSMVYPPLAIESGQEGTVMVRVLIGKDGKVIKVYSVSGPEVFYDEVKEKAMDLEFTVGLQNGNPVMVLMTVPFRFKLKN